MEHNDVRHRLSEYIDGSVTGEERAAIEAHLKTCPQCSSALEELRKTIEHIKTVEEIDPPAWMTQKIMAKVRAEATENKDFFHRFFFPLRIKIPIQAIAVLFLAVTGFYIYQNIHPAERVTEAPVQEFAPTVQAPQTDTAQDKIAKTDGQAVRSKQVPQAPSYNALDMKQEYETPPPPVPAEKAAGPAADGSGGQPAPAHNEMTSGKRSAAPQAIAPAPLQTVPSARAALQAEGTREPAPLQQKKAKSAVADGGAGLEISRPETTLTVSVKNIDAAAKDIEAAINEFHGTIIKSEQLGAKRIYILSLDTSHANDLVEKLKHVGAIKEINQVIESRESRMVFRIELYRRAAANVGC